MFLPTNKEIYQSGIDRASELAVNGIEGFSDLVIQLAMANEFSSISELFDEEESLTLSVNDFLSSTDKNVIAMIKVLNALRDFQDVVDE